MKIKVTVVVLILVAAAVFAYTRMHKGETGDVSVPEHNSLTLEGIPKSNISANTYSAGPLLKPVEWVTISGGKFMMGSDSADRNFSSAKPVHEVIIKTFEMSKTAVTVEQYTECLNKGECTPPGSGGQCNWGMAGRESHPINCVDWDQANQYAKFKGGRLPSESEWEYAARSGGKKQKYPWGDDEPACVKAVINGAGGEGCAKDTTMPVCSKPAGNTAQGLCDMAGNVWQWVQDKYLDSYKGSPTDGSSYEGEGIYPGNYRVVRGGTFYGKVVRNLRADYRGYFEPNSRNDTRTGFRLARPR